MEAFQIEQQAQGQQPSPQASCSSWPLSEWLLIIGAGILVIGGIFAITLVFIVESQLNSPASVSFSTEEIEAKLTPHFPPATLSLDFAINFTVSTTKLSAGKFEFYDTFWVFSIGNGTWKMKTALVSLPPVSASEDDAHCEWLVQSTGKVTNITFSKLALIYKDEVVPMTQVISGKNSDHEPFNATCPMEVHLKNSKPPKLYACKVVP